jgi:ribonuclease HII
VVTAAVVLRGRMNGLADSKTLLPERRCTLYAELALRVRQGRAWIALGIASAQEIDRLNIRAASLLAMRRAVARLPLVPERILIDGDALPEPLPCRAEAIVDGDAQVPCIAAASIVAKVVRDRLMARLGELHPGYGWDRNAGYGTPEHLRALAALGPNGQHRQSFRPVSLMLGLD